MLGQDGLSFAPATSPAAFTYASRYFAAVNGPHPHVDGPVSVAGLLAGYDGATPLNTVYLLPHATIRFDAMGPAERAADADELRAMLRAVETGLAEGAAGLSSGLEYAPGRYADAAELAALCAPLGDLPYVTHMRAYGASAAVGMTEVVEIARRSGAAVHVSHLHGPASTLLPLVEDARRQDVDLTFDTYPYLRASTILAMVTLPPWVPAADPDRAVAMLSAERDRLAREWAGRDDLWPRITLSHAPGFEWAEGMTLPAAAAEFGADPAEFCRMLLVETRLQAGCVQARPDEGPAGRSRCAPSCATPATRAAPTASTWAAIRTRAASGRSPAISAGTYASSATSPGNRPPCTWPRTRRAASGCPTAVSYGVARPRI